MRPVKDVAEQLAFESVAPLLSPWLQQPCKILAQLSSKDFLVVKNGQLGWIDTSAANVSFNSIGSIACNNPRCALRLADRRAVVMDDDGSSEVYFADNAYKARRISTRPGHIRFQATAAGTISETVEARTLSRTYKGTASIKAADATALCNDYVRAYSQVAARAAELGLYIHPVVAWANYYDGRGNFLYRSAPSLVSLPAPGEGLDYRSLFSTDGNVVQAYSVTAATYKLEAITCGDDDPDVARIDIVVSPQFHPCNPAGTGVVTLARQAEADGVFAHVALPGRGLGLRAGSEVSVQRVRRLLERIDGVNTVALSFKASSEAQALMVANMRTDGVAAETTELEKILVRKPVNVGFTDILLSAPNTISASVVSADAQTVLWGDLQVGRFKGFDAFHFAASVSDTPWRCLMTVFFGGDDTGVTRTTEMESDCPLSLGPLLSYPAPDATAIDIITYSAGITRRGRFPLTPDASGRHACYISPDFKPFELPQVSAAQIIDVAQSELRFPNVLAAASLQSPLALRFHCVAGSDRVEAVSMLSAGDTSWEFGRSRFVAGTAEGLFSVAVGSTKLSVRHIDFRGIAGPRALASAPGCVFAATSEGLLRIDAGACSVKLLKQGNFDSVASLQHHREVCAAGNAGLWHFAADLAYMPFEQEKAGVSAVQSLGGSAFAFNSAGVLSFGRETTDSDAIIDWRALVPGSGRLRSVALGLTGHFQGLLSVHTADACGNAVALCAQVTVNGNIKGCLHVPCPMRKSGSYVVRLHGKGRIVISSLTPVFE